MKIISKLLTALSAVLGARSLQRMVRRLVVISLGKENSDNLYGKDNAPDHLKAEAERIGMSVVSCDDAAWNDSLLNWVIDPLAYPKQEQRKRQQNKIALRDGLRLDSDGCNETGSASDSEGVPPVINLKPGERITHVVCPSNDPSSATASAGRVERTVRSQFPATLERPAQRPFAAAHG